MKPSSLDYIFREYDIRGRVDTELDDATVIRIGRAIGTFYRRHNITGMTLGRDCRLSSDRLRNALVEGLLATGMQVTDIGVCHTPLLYYALFHLDLQAGVMITGSHNPPECNGFKVCFGKSTLYGEQIQQLRTLAVTNDFETGTGTLQECSILQPYMDHIADDIHTARRLKVVVDAGNGTAGIAAVPLLQRIGCDVVPLYCEPDGRFPHHHPDPTIPEYLTDLIATVRETSADLGIAYDGDGDRIGVINEQGSILWGDQLMIIFSRDILARRPGATIISEVKASQTLYDDIRMRGGRPIMWKTGHSLIKAKMKSEDAVLAGEMSGHMFFADRYFGFDDAIYASCRLIEIVSRGKFPLSRYLADVSRLHATPEIRIECPDDKKFQVVEAVKAVFQPRYETISIDGVRVILPDGWALLRASNTQPVLVMRCEAATPERLAQIHADMSAEVQRAMSAV